MLTSDSATADHPAQWHDIAACVDIPEGKMQGFVVAGRDVVVCHTKDSWHAVDNICSHAFVKMDEGRLRGFRLICPLHGASFDCRSGAVLGAPATKPLACWQVRIQGERIEVALPATP